MAHRISLLALPALATSLACQADDAPTEATGLVRDSAGIEIVESATPTWTGEAWTVSAEPSLSIGRTDGDERYLFGFIRGALALRDGRIAVLDQYGAMVRVYTPEGEHIEDWGGEGEGPGEFHFPASIFPYRGDSIVVSQLIDGGLSIFDDRGRFGRRAMPAAWHSFAAGLRDIVAEGSAIPSDSCCRFWGPLTTGAFLISYPDMIPTTGTGMQRGSVAVAITPDSGGAAETVDDLKGGRYLPGPTRRSLPQYFQFPLWPNMAAGPDGFFATEGDAYSVNSYDAAGRLRRIIRLARGPRPVTDRIRSAHEEEVRARNLDPEALERALASPYPTHLPTFFRLLVDPDGNLWAVQRRYDPGDEPTATDMHDYFVFGPDGRHLGLVEVPARLQAFQIGADFILGKVTDDLGVEYVHRHEIEK